MQAAAAPAGKASAVKASGAKEQTCNCEDGHTALKGAANAISMSLGMVVGSTWTDTYSKESFPLCPDTFMQVPDRQEWGYDEAAKTACYVENPKLPE